MVQEPAETEKCCAVSVDICGIERLLDLSTAALRDEGIIRARYPLERTSALYLLALCMLKARDRQTAIPHFLEAALPLLASSQIEQTVLYRRYHRQDRSNIIEGIFCLNTNSEAQPNVSRPRSEPIPDPADLRDAEAQIFENATSSRSCKIRGMRRRLASKRRVRLLRKHVSLLAERYTLSLPAIRVGQRTSLRESARNASFRLPTPTKKLHAEKTVRATVQEAGYFTPIWRTKFATNEYLFLIRQLSRNDFEYQRIRTQILDLRDQGVFLNIYSFNEDPRILWDALSNEYGDHLRLEQLHQRHPDARLILVSEGRELLNRLTYMPLSVADELTLWPYRALITPLPSADWGSIEGIIHYDLGFSIASSRENGFSRLNQLFGAKSLGPTALHSNDLRAAITPQFVASPDLRYVEDAAPPPQEQDKVIFELQLYLEASGFLWLATCAFFPVTTPAIAKFFEHKLNIADREGTIFARLCVLPWMRFGHMPRWLRKRLEQTLTESERSQARRAAASLLCEENLAEKGEGEFSPGDEPASGGESLILPMRIDIDGGGETELDELGIELLSAGTREEIDPIFRVSPALHAKLLKAAPSKGADVYRIPKPDRPRLSPTERKALSVMPGRSLVLPARDKTQPATPSNDFREEYFDLLASNASIVNYLRERAGDTLNFQMHSLNVSHVIDPDATSSVSRSYVISSCAKTAIPFDMWVAADEESDRIRGFRPLSIRIVDKRSGQNFAMLATVDEPRRKVFAIIFPDLQHGEQKEFEVCYRWPGLMKRILEKGSTDFYWSYRTASPGIRVDVTYDWLFLRGFPTVTLKLKGDHGGASLRYQELPEGQRWTYHDPAALVEGRTFTVSVTRL